MLLSNAHPMARLTALVLLLAQVVAAWGPTRVACLSAGSWNECALPTADTCGDSQGEDVDLAVGSADACCGHDSGEAVSGLVPPPPCDCHVHVPTPSDPRPPAHRPGERPTLGSTDTTPMPVATGLIWANLSTPVMRTAPTSPHSGNRAQTRALETTRLRI